MNNIVFLRKSRVIEELQSVVSFKDVQFCTITRKPITPPKKNIRYSLSNLKLYLINIKLGLFFLCFIQMMSECHSIKNLRVTLLCFLLFSPFDTAWESSRNVS